jgi:hypothetical protein
MWSRTTYKGAFEEALEVVLAAPEADCTDMIGNYGVNDDRSAVPLEGREATLKGDILFAGILSSSALMEDHSTLARTGYTRRPS